MNKILFRIVLIIGVIVVAASAVYHFVFQNSSENVSIVTSSTLTKAIDISELSTAEFRYRGIADVYTDDTKEKPRCKICYNAVVKAGIEMKDVDFDVDSEKKVVTVALPEIEIKVNIIDEDSMKILLRIQMSVWQIC